VHFEVGDKRKISRVNLQTKPPNAVVGRVGTPASGSNEAFVEMIEAGANIFTQIATGISEAAGQQCIQLEARKAEGGFFEAADMRFGLLRQ
jgi:hypothetical protein